MKLICPRCKSKTALPEGHPGVKCSTCGLGMLRPADPPMGAPPEPPIEPPCEAQPSMRSDVTRGGVILIGLGVAVWFLAGVCGLAADEEHDATGVDRIVGAIAALAWVVVGASLFLAGFLSREYWRGRD